MPICTSFQCACCGPRMPAIMIAGLFGKLVGKSNREGIFTDSSIGSEVHEGKRIDVHSVLQYFIRAYTEAYGELYGQSAGSQISMAQCFPVVYYIAVIPCIPYQSCGRTVFPVHKRNCFAHTDRVPVRDKGSMQ